MNVYIKRLGISAFAAAIIVGFAATHSSSKTEIITAGVDISSAPVVCLEIPEATQQIEIDELPAPKETAVVESLDIPELSDSSFKSYMDFRTITCTASDQYRMQQEAYTDEYGLRKIGDYYCVALGTYYTPRCGATFHIITDNGNEFDVIVADIKADVHTDSTNRYVPMADGMGNIVEFIVDTSELDEYVRLLGSVDGYDHLSGNIVAIQKI